MSKEKPMVSAVKVPRVRYSAAYPTGESVVRKDFFTMGSS